MTPEGIYQRFTFPADKTHASPPPRCNPDGPRLAWVPSPYTLTRACVNRPSNKRQKGVTDNDSGS